jgi:hypothetical protein
MYKKSQAALEFLTTYAWAFLVILVMIAALAYFGVLKPSRILPDRCNFGSEIGCEDYSLTYGGGDTATFNMRLRSNVGETIIIQDIGTGTALGVGLDLDSDATTPFDCTAFTTPTPTDEDGDTVADDFLWGSGTSATQEFQFTGCNDDSSGINKGDKAKIVVTITYYTAKSGSNYPHVVSGEILTTVN